MPFPTLLELRNPGEMFQPSHDQLLIEPIDAPGVTNGGIILTPTSRAPTTNGKIIAVGKGQTCPLTGTIHPLDHKVGDRIVFRPMAQLFEVKVCGVTYLLGRDCEVAGRIVKSEGPVCPAEACTDAPI